MNRLRSWLLADYRRKVGPGWLDALRETLGLLAAACLVPRIVHDASTWRLDVPQDLLVAVLMVLPMALLIVASMTDATELHRD